MNSSVTKLLPESEHFAFEKSLASYPPRAFRFRPSLASAAPPMATFTVPWFPLGRVVESSKVRPSQFFHYVTGDYYIQDAGSMLALALLDVQPGEAICDLCAAPGGKATSILESLAECNPDKLGGGWLLANEPIRSRMPILEYALARTGHLRYATLNNDPAEVAEKFAASFDAVLVDAPCSGQALVANEKHDASAFDQRHIDHNAARQRRILLEAVRLLKPGGRIIYSTCTFAMEENEAQVEFLMREFPGAFEPIHLDSLSPWASRVTPGCYRLWPHRDPTAGAFAAGFRLVGEVPTKSRTEERHAPRKDARWQERNATRRLNGSRPHGKNSETSDSLASSGLDLLSQFCIPIHVRARLLENRVTAIAGDVLTNESLLYSRWPELLKKSGKHWEPQHALAVANPTHLTHAYQIELTQPEVRNYLSGQAIPKKTSTQTRAGVIDTSSIKKVWCVATYNQKPIGWLKDAGNRFNNQLPRIAYHSFCTS